MGPGVNPESRKSGKDFITVDSKEERFLNFHVHQVWTIIGFGGGCFDLLHLEDIWKPWEF